MILVPYNHKRLAAVFRLPGALFLFPSYFSSSASLSRIWKNFSKIPVPIPSLYDIMTLFRSIKHSEYQIPRGVYAARSDVQQTGVRRTAHGGSGKGKNILCRAEFILWKVSARSTDPEPGSWYSCRVVPCGALTAITPTPGT